MTRIEHDAAKWNHLASQTCGKNNQLDHDVVREPVPAFRHHGLAAASDPKSPDKAPDLPPPPIREPEPDRLPDETPVPNPDESDEPPIHV